MSDSDRRRRVNSDGSFIHEAETESLTVLPDGMGLYYSWGQLVRVYYPDGRLWTLPNGYWHIKGHKYDPDWEADWDAIESQCHILKRWLPQRYPKILPSALMDTFKIKTNVGLLSHDNGRKQLDLCQKYAESRSIKFRLYRAHMVCENGSTFRTFKGPKSMRGEPMDITWLDESFMLSDSIEESLWTIDYWMRFPGSRVLWAQDLQAEPISLDYAGFRQKIAEFI